MYVAWLVMFVLSVPLAFNLVPANVIYGIRFTSTLSNADIWRRANRFAGWALMIASLIGAAITRQFTTTADMLGVILPGAMLMIVILCTFVYIKVIDRSVRNQ